MEKFCHGFCSKMIWPLFHYFPSYAASQVALITPLRDGMNLIAKKYVASRPDKTGVLILSEMAGASKDLAEAFVINPNSVGEIAAALRAALEMPEEEQIRRNEIMQRRLQHYHVVRWADEFLTCLSAVKAEGNRLRSRLLGPPAREQLLGDFGRARRRALFLDTHNQTEAMGLLGELAKRHLSGSPASASAGGARGGCSR